MHQLLGLAMSVVLFFSCKHVTNFQSQQAEQIQISADGHVLIPAPLLVEGQELDYVLYRYLEGAGTASWGDILADEPVTLKTAFKKDSVILESADRKTRIELKVIEQKPEGYEVLLQDVLPDQITTAEAKRGSDGKVIVNEAGRPSEGWRDESFPIKEREGLAVRTSTLRFSVLQNVSVKPRFTDRWSQAAWIKRVEHVFRIRHSSGEFKARSVEKSQADRFRSNAQSMIERIDSEGTPLVFQFEASMPYAAKLGIQGGIDYWNKAMGREIFRISAELSERKTDFLARNIFVWSSNPLQSAMTVAPARSDTGEILDGLAVIFPNAFFYKGATEMDRASYFASISARELGHLLGLADNGYSAEPPVTIMGIPADSAAIACGKAILNSKPVLPYDQSAINFIYKAGAWDENLRKRFKAIPR